VHGRYEVAADTQSRVDVGQSGRDVPVLLDHRGHLRQIRRIGQLPAQHRPEVVVLGGMVVVELLSSPLVAPT